MRLLQSSYIRWTAAFLAVAVLAILPPLLDLRPYQIHVLIVIAYFAYLGAAWNIMAGYAGQVSFGHAAFFGVGAYTSTLLFTRAGISPWVGMFAGAALAGVLGVAIGALSFRYNLRGVYFALGTFAFAEILRVIFINWEQVGGSNGIAFRVARTWPEAMIFLDKLPYYWLILGMLAIILIITWFIGRSRLGYNFLAVRENEIAAQHLGVDVFQTKIIAVAISAALTAPAGTFYAQYYQFIDPYGSFGSQVSLDLMLRTVVGGMGLLWGPVAGSILLTPLGEFTRQLLEGRPGIDIMFYGVMLVLVMLFLPQGLLSLGDQLQSRKLHRSIVRLLKTFFTTNRGTAEVD